MKVSRLLSLLTLAAIPCVLHGQPKISGRVPIREKRGYDQQTVIDTANIRVLYALNAKDIKQDSTYVDLGKLEVGRKVRKYSSEFLDISDEEIKKWKVRENYSDNAYVPMTLFMGGRKDLMDNWCELVFSDYFVRGNELTEYACFPGYAERENGRYTEPWPLMKWTLKDEHLTILGHNCQKATCHFRGRDFVAWFAADVPIKGGPWKFGGLPGCILKVYDVQKLYVWEAVAIERGTYPIMQYSDKLYPPSTRKSVWQRQRKYTEDYWNAIGIVFLDRPQPKKIPFEQLEKE